MLFSQRIGVTPVPEALSPEVMPSALRNSLWNAVLDWRNTSLTTTHEGGALRALWTDLWKLPVDQMPVTVFTSSSGKRYDYKKTWATVREWYFKLEWAHVYDFIDFLIAKSDKGEKLGVLVNGVLERELAAYRVVARRLVPVTNKHEIAAIQEAISTNASFDGASHHIATALAHLSDRASPDFRNSIKESISAVESAAKAVTGLQKAELGPALTKLESSGQLHGALRKAYLALYGYTSDADGIRHGLMDEPNLTADDAKYFLIVCSAFVNYLKTRIG